jgi:predicted RNA binding protein YcfA (HicA-like mRNA interferase family)
MSRTPHRVRLPEEFLGLFLRPDGRLPAFAQRRLDGLIDKSKADELTREEERELAEMVEYVDWQADKIEGMKVRAVLQLIESDGWHLVAQRGSHRQYKHAVKPGRVTVPGHVNDDIKPGKSIFRQAGLRQR